MIKPLSYFLYRLKYRYARELNLNIPVDVSLELSSACNQKCGYCYHASKETLPFQQGNMTYDTAMLIIADASTIGVNSLKFNWKGESTLNPRFKDITKFAKQHASGSTFIDRITNSNFKFSPNRNDIFEGLCNQTKVKVSFDSFIPEVMEKQRAGSVHSQTMKNIDIFYHHKDRKNTELVIQAVRTNLNKNEDIEHQAKLRWPEAKVSIRDMVAGRVDKDLSELENKKRDDSERESCIQAHARLVFNWQGDAMMCCVDLAEKINLGSIHDKSIYQIFNSEKAKRVRKKLLDKSAFDLNPCRTCSSHESYKNYKAPWGS